MMRGNFENTVLLTKAILRRERINSTLWLLVSALFMGFVAFLFTAAMDEASRMEMAAVIQSPAMVAMVGPVYGLDNYTMGAMYTNMMLLFSALAFITMNVMLVVRHTRSDEEKGRYEVVRSLPVGRMANIHATMISAVIINILLAVLIGLSLYLFGDGSMCFAGSMLWGTLMGCIGLVFAAVAALFSQISPSSRGAVGFSLLFMGLLYMMRAVGDVSAEILSLLSPLGLLSRSQAYVENHWWPVPVLLAVAVFVSAAAYVLNAKRDIDRGLLPDKQGRAHAGKLLRTSFGLSLRLLRTPLIVGFITVFCIAAAYGAIMNDIEGFIGTNEMYRQLMMLPEDIGGISSSELLLAFLGMIHFIASLMALVAMLIFLLKVRSEEKEIRAETVLAAPVSRYKYLGGYVIIAFVSSVVLQLATAVGLWMSGTAVLENPSDMPLSDLLTANLVYLPALWIVIGIAVLLIGVTPKASGLIWMVYGFVFFVGFLGRLPVFPEWFPKIAPYGYIPQYPMDDINFLTLGLMTAVAGVLTAAGFYFYGRRDTNTH
jgi:ABC-2 type transport system permease protein